MTSKTKRNCGKRLRHGLKLVDCTSVPSRDLRSRTRPRKPVRPHREVLTRYHAPLYPPRSTDNDGAYMATQITAGRRTDAGIE